MPRELSFRRKQLLGLMRLVPQTALDMAWAVKREPTNVTRDLLIMHRDGLVGRERKGLHVYYSLTSKGRKHLPDGAR